MDTEKSAILGEGSYGCVIRPPALCKKSKVRATTKIVGKLLKKKNAEIELRIGALVKGIPSWERYYIIQEEDNCDSSNFKEIRREYAEDCRILQDDHLRISNLTQTISTYGGKTLHETFPTSSFHYIQSFRHVLEGVHKLQGQGICHFDLKEGNMVIDEHNVIRFIDFGAAFVGDTTTDANVVRRIYDFIPEYNTLSPEVSVQNGLYYKKHTMRELYHDTIYKKYVFVLMESFLGIPREKCRDDLEKFWTTYYAEKEGEGWDEFFRKYWRMWDTWAVGVIFIKILKRCLLYSTFIENTWKPHGLVIKEVLRGLLEVDPRKRLSAEGALKMLDV